MERKIFWILKIAEVLGTTAILWLVITYPAIFEIIIIIITTVFITGVVVAIIYMVISSLFKMWVNKNKKWAKKIVKLLNHKEK